VLSAVAQQVSELQAAVRAKLKSFVFEGTELPLRLSCNVFITMNPGCGLGVVGASLAAATRRPCSVPLPPLAGPA
jgi:hypothetical protein